MKKIILFFLGLFSFSAFSDSTHILLKYDFGNQITRSSYSVLSDGLVMRSKSLYGKASYLPDQKLTADQLKKVIMAIDQSVVKGKLLDKEGSPTLLGSSSGTLFAYTSDGFFLPIFVSSRAEKVGDHDRLVYQSGEDGQFLRKLVDDQVDNKMPLKLIEE